MCLWNQEILKIPDKEFSIYHFFKKKQGSSTWPSEAGKHVHLFIFISSFGVYLPRVFLWRSENSNLQTKSLSSILLDVSFLLSEVVSPMCSVKKTFLEISQNSQENTCARVSFSIKLQAFNFIKKETLAQVFSCEFFDISKNTFFDRAPLVAALYLEKKVFWLEDYLPYKQRSI